MDTINTQDSYASGFASGCGTVVLVLLILVFSVGYFLPPSTNNSCIDHSALPKLIDDEAAMDQAVDAVVEEAVKCKEEIKENLEEFYQDGKEKAKEIVNSSLSPAKKIEISSETEAAVDEAVHAGINNLVEAGVENKETIKAKGKQAYRDMKKALTSTTVY
ncbi:MAG: hypothetical protein IJQ31_00165 [Thermoguttaceae bacterium]|nr:hypothetical protein [Thermoguttaceae bacterium]